MIIAWWIIRWFKEAYMSPEIMQLDWLNPEKSILLATLPKQWTGPQFIELRQRVNALRDKVTQVVHTIVDVRQSERIPNDFVTSFPQISRLEHPRAGISVWVANPSSPLVGQLLDIYEHVYRVKLPVVGSVEEAVVYIEQNA
jgi:hypothetical protein